VIWTPVFRNLTALLQILLILLLVACGTTVAKTPSRPSDIRVSVAAPDQPALPGAPVPETEPSKPERIAAAPAPPRAGPAPAPPPVPAMSMPGATAPLPPPSAGTPERPSPVLSSQDRSSQDRGPAVRLRQAQTAEKAAEAQPAAQAPGRLVVFNFDNADIEIVLQATSELLVFNYVLAPEARGKKVTVQTTGRIPVDDIFPVLLTILDVNGLSAIKSGSVYRIIAKQGAPQTSTRTIVGAQLDPSVPGDEVMTQVVPLRFVNSADMLGLLRPFVPQQGALTAHRDTNLLVVTDVASNIRRLLDIVKLVDVDVTTSELAIIQLKHADAQEVAQILTQLFASGRFRSAGAQISGGPAPAAVPGAPAPALRPGAPGAVTESSGADRAPLIVPEKRSNSLIIYARKQEMETISRLIEKLDADIYGAQRVFFYFCENTKAKDLAATLDAIFGRGTGAAPQQQARPTTGPSGSGLPSLQAQPRTTTPYAPPASGGGSGGPGGLLGDAAPIGADTRFIPDEVTNSIIVTTYPRVWTEIEQIIKKLDRMPRQVLIEVLAAEISLDDSTSLGIQWAIRHGRFDANFTSPTGSITTRPAPGVLDPAFGLLGAAAANSFLPGLNFFTFAANEFLTAINVLASEDKVTILSSPSVMTTENKKAIINVSKSVPVLTSQQTPIGGTTTTDQTTTQAIVGTQTVEYKDVGIVLTVTPRIGEQGTVALDIKQEVNDILQQQVPPTNSPSFSKREAETSVVLLNNQTLVLGGLIQTRRESIKTGIPFLNKIPVLGYLFGNTTASIGKTELLLLITPRVVGTALDANRITDQMRRITPELRESIQQKQFPYPSFEYLKP
jgi:general secretion pathway protein D